jgi:hypothetical protein
VLKSLFLLFFVVVASVAFAGSTSFSWSSESDQLIAKKLLLDAIQLFNSDLRNPGSGQYYDAVNLSESKGNLAAATGQIETVSSSAATGMGLVSLAIGDATGAVRDANIKTVQTLAAVLNPKFSRRHSKGWLRHWFNAQNGSDNAWSATDGYSTIDTAILAAGAVLSSNYFKTTGKDPLNTIEDLTNNFLNSVDWSSAIADMNNGRLIMNFDLESEVPKKLTSKFNEYLLVSCIGKLSESRRGVNGPMTEFWNRHFKNADLLPQKWYASSDGPVTVLTDSPFHYLSSFAIQFTYYLCADVNNDSRYLSFIKNAQTVDREWFLDQRDNPEGWWGSGAGEATRGYQANAAFNNPDLIVSPQIVSGYMSEQPEMLSDLIKMYKSNFFTYYKGEKEILWRHSLVRPDKPLLRLQAIDFSTMIFGLATTQPEVGTIFFKNYAAGK